MNEIAIKAQGLGKRYSLGGRSGSYKTIRESLSSMWRSAAGGLKRRPTGGAGVEFWALKDASFEIKCGEAVGILGRNGAGKSTLLKVLSRITRPTTGYADVVGRVGSLLEVGTGFHPELTGRENVFLNGAIMGISAPDIRRQFDSIVDFADIEKFIDTPVKRYSSGMYTRLAFAVAAHMQPDILLVDEVLAVGDAAFQKKCLGKMSDVAKSGRTVLFVSHQMGAITTLCDRAILLEHGSVACIGGAAEVVARYLSAGAERSGYANLAEVPTRTGTGELRLTDIALRDSSGTLTPNFSIGDDITIDFGLVRKERVNGVRLAIQLTTSDGLNIAHMIDQDSGFALTNVREKEQLSATLRDVRLYPGVL